MTVPNTRFSQVGFITTPELRRRPLAHLGIGAAEAETLTAGWSAVRVVDLDVLRCYALRP